MGRLSRVEGANECLDGVLEEGTEAEVEDVTQDFYQCGGLCMFIF